MKAAGEPDLDQVERRRAAVREAMRRYRARHPERVADATKRNNAKSGKARSNRYYAAHAEQRRADRREYYWKNKDKQREYAQKWGAQNAGKKAANLRRWAKQNPERKADLNREWIAKNRARYNAIKSRRRKNVVCATPPWVTLDDLAAIYEGCPPGHQVDHIFPIMGKTSCGLHVPWNLQYLTADENRKKGNRCPTW